MGSCQLNRNYGRKPDLIIVHWETMKIYKHASHSHVGWDGHSGTELGVPSPYKDNSFSSCFVFISMTESWTTFCLHLFIKFLLCVRGAHMPVGMAAFVLQCPCRGQRAAHRSQFSTVGSKNWTQVLKLSANTFTHWALLPVLEQSFWLFKKFFFYITLLLGLALKFK